MRSVRPRHPDDGGGLSEASHAVRHQAGCRPGKSCEQMAAQPLRQCNGCCKIEGKLEPGSAQALCQHGSKAPINGHAACKDAQHEGHHPQIGRSLDQEGKPDPVKGHNEIAEPEKPAGAETAPPGRPLFRVEQQQENREANEGQGPEIEGRQGQGAQGAGGQRKRAARGGGQARYAMIKSNHVPGTIGGGPFVW